MMVLTVLAVSVVTATPLISSCAAIFGKLRCRSCTAAFAFLQCGSHLYQKLRAATSEKLHCNIESCVAGKSRFPADF